MSTTILTADEGYYYINNEGIYGKIIYLGVNDSSDNWRLIKEEDISSTEEISELEEYKIFYNNVMNKLPNIEIKEIKINKIIEDSKNVTNYINRLIAEGAKANQKDTSNSAPTAGIFKKGYPEWKGDGGLEKQGHLSYYPITDMVYKCRVDSFRNPDQSPDRAINNYSPCPCPDEKGVYTYTYNMDSEIGMLIYDKTDGNIYECYANPIIAMIWPPSQLPASFKIIEE